ncbi:hypothetical protein O4H66_02810 [Comamonadaceae bacterium G21597-S1]|nr:hypothetical protein [Comamonadaceae bacterium G21597-S1]
MVHSPPRLRVRDVDIRVRPVQLRLPFKFGAVTLRACPQVFVRARITIDGGATANGHAAEMMVPKWFDKRVQRSHGDNVSDLALSLTSAREAYLAEAAETAFGLSDRCYQPLVAQAKAAGMTDLSAAYGPALLDRAILDAVCRALGVSVFDAMRGNLAGITDSTLAPDLRGFDWSAWLSRLAPLHQLQARHTVGMLDPLEPAQHSPDPHALPDDLASVIRRYGHRFFKIKLGGDPAQDLSRLADVLALLAREAPQARFSLDGNEQYGNPAALLALFEGMHNLPQLQRAPDALLYIEQPVPRDQSLDTHLPADLAPAPLLMDEADGRSDAFLLGRACGWRGVSSKSCKGLYKAFINRARCDAWNRDDPQPSPFFMSAEDLTCQAGLAVQQDLALASMLGLQHCERNGHHYVDGMAAYPADERAAFAAAHPDLYESASGHPRLRITQGAIAIDSLFGTGFASGVEPDWASTQDLSTAASHV